MASIQKPVTKIVEFPERELSIKALTIQPELMQTRAGTDVRIVRAYAKAKTGGSVFPPVVVFHTPEDENLLADGFTRVAAWQSLRLPSIRCVIREGTREEAILYGIEMNFNPDNIREVTPDDRAHAVKIMIRNETFRVWTDALIAKQCGVNRAVVQRIRLQLRDESGIPLPEKVKFFRKVKGVHKEFTRNYLNDPGRITLRVSGLYTANVNGQVLSLTENPEVAARRMDEIKKRSIRWEQACKYDHLGYWLADYGISSRARNEKTLGGLLVGGAVVLTLKEMNAENLLVEVGRTVLIRIQDGPDQRVIFAGYLMGSPTLQRFVSIARQLTPPIEFMTPEELVAEFGPKGAGGRPIEPDADAKSRPDSDADAAPGETPDEA